MNVHDQVHEPMLQCASCHKPKVSHRLRLHLYHPHVATHCKVTAVCACTHTHDTHKTHTTVIVDHFGFCKFEDLASEEWRRLLALARHPQVLQAGRKGV